MSNSKMPSEGPEMTGPEAEKVAFERLARAVATYRSSEFSRVELEYSAAGPMDEATLRAVRTDGTTTSFKLPDVFDASKDLRAAMNRPKSGTWFSIRMAVSAAGSVDASFNYDELAPTSFDFGPGAYANDLLKYPRDTSHIPVWLSEKVEEYNKMTDSQ
jgi:hypothetical protein